ncbi:kinase-like domain-containing protein [Tolypocladium paradoxum]|uniref:Kinase-like domain-containing protein n=1 Tax=Tolypocladium paradoxum TaxID=94208 RepID=A0A2S4KZZ7_9HYPO|nr:kinase-like domain-containing protein [Tolypocladium paradoxum]
MADPPIDDSLWIRFLTLIAVRVLTQTYLQRFWKHPGGVLFVSKFCIKIRPFANLAEAHTMRFLSHHTSIPVPKIHCAFIYRGRSYTVMEKIAGERAGQAWAQRSEESREKIVGQLRSIIRQLRAVSPPAGAGVANILGGPIYDARLPGESLRGPFSTVDNFHKSLRNGITLEGHHGVPGDLQELATFHKQASSRSVLTHGDLSSLNILVRGDEVVGIIDWETAGWLPLYWEYTCAWNVNPQNEFWRHEVDKFLTPMQHELRMEGIRRKYFGDF